MKNFSINSSGGVLLHGNEVTPFKLKPNAPFAIQQIDGRIRSIVRTQVGLNKVLNELKEHGFINEIEKTLLLPILTKKLKAARKMRKETHRLINEVEVRGVETAEGQFLLNYEDNFSVLLGDRILLSGIVNKKEVKLAAYVPDDICLNEYLDDVYLEVAQGVLGSHNQFVYFSKEDIEPFLFESQKEIFTLVKELNQVGYINAHTAMKIIKDIPKLNGILPKETPRSKPEVGQININDLEQYAERLGFSLKLFDLPVV